MKNKKAEIIENKNGYEVVFGREINGEFVVSYYSKPRIYKKLSSAKKAKSHWEN